MHINKEGPTQGLNDVTITAEAKYPINFSRSRKMICVKLHYNGSNTFANTTKIYQFKAKSCEINPYLLCV